MVLFTILVIILIAIAVAILFCGASFLLVFGDVLICGALIYFIIKALLRR